jgi:hypothetical protein
MNKVVALDLFVLAQEEDCAHVDACEDDHFEV